MKIKLFNNIKLNIDLSFIFFIILMLFLSFYRIIYTIILSLFIHELSHILIYVWISKKHNFKGEILLTLSIFGGICSINYHFFKKREKILLFLSGIIGTTILLILTHRNLYFYKYNLLLLIFNMLPIYPLDGYNILNQFSFFNNKIKKVFTYLIILFLFVLVIFSKSFGILIIIIFLLFKNFKNKEEDILNKLYNINYYLKNKGYCIENFKKI